MENFRSILHPTDFSEASQFAGERAVQLAKQCGARLTVLHAYANPTAVPDAWNVPDPVPQLQEAISAVAADEPNLPIERVLRVGVPAEMIVEFARRQHCDLIVMGTHGRTGLRHLLLGSVAEQVIRLSPCPVMVVGPETVPAASKAERQTKHVVVV